MTPLEQLRQLAQEFVDGHDRSMLAVWKIEDILVTEFLDTELFEELTETVSLYRPGEGRPYCDEEQMSQALQEAFSITPSN